MKRERITEQEREEIVQQFREGRPLNDIARDFDTYSGFVSALALKRGEKPRHRFGRVQRSVKLTVQLDEELQRTARRQRTTTTALINEAIAAYLGVER